MAQFPEEQSKSGEFRRQEDAFRDWVKRDGSTPYEPERGRYHLYVSLACPWAHRIIILRKLKVLEETIGMTVVDPVRDERGWALPCWFRILVSLALMGAWGVEGKGTSLWFWDASQKQRRREIVSSQEGQGPIPWLSLIPGAAVVALEQLPELIKLA